MKVEFSNLKFIF